MQNDGRVLPSLAETVVLHRLGLIRTDELPMVAARWLAADVVDTESIRLLAGHDPHDPWELERLLVVAADEVGVTPPTDPAAEENIAVNWVTNNWHEDRTPGLRSPSLLVSARLISTGTLACSSDLMTSGTVVGDGLSLI